MTWNGMVNSSATTLSLLSISIVWSTQPFICQHNSHERQVTYVSILIWKHLFLSVRILALFTCVSIHMTKHCFICYHSHAVIGKPKPSLHLCEYGHDLQQQPSTCMSCIYIILMATSLLGSLLIPVLISFMVSLNCS